MKTVLIADDDRLVRSSIGRALQEAGYRVVEAEDGQDAYDKAKAEQPDFVIADQEMPQMSGDELVKILRKESWAKEVPMVMLSAHDDVDDVNKALRAGITTYLSKANMSLDEIVRFVDSNFPS